jgi:hypothetical protein
MNKALPCLRIGWVSASSELDFIATVDCRLPKTNLSDLSPFISGLLRRKRGNDRNTYKPIRPNSMAIPTEPSLESQSEQGEWTDANSKTTGSKSCGSKYNRVNQTASLSFTSDEGSSESETPHDDESTSRRSEQTHSVTYPSVNDGNSTLNTDGNTSRKQDRASNATGRGHCTSNSPPRRNGKGVTSMRRHDRDADSTGVSASVYSDEDSCDTSSRDNSRDRYAASSSSTSSVSSSSTSDDGNDSSSDGTDDSASSGSFCTDEDSESTSSSTWEDVPECGYFVNVKPKLGERVSRVTPDHTSHLLRSRFRKKYFPRGGV